jgi:hypothetical protein
LSFYSNKSIVDKDTLDGANFILLLEKEMDKEVIQPFIYFDTLFLPEVFVTSVSNNI